MENPRVNPTSKYGFHGSVCGKGGDGSGAPTASIHNIPPGVCLDSRCGRLKHSRGGTIIENGLDSCARYPLNRKTAEKVKEEDIAFLNF